MPTSFTGPTWSYITPDDGDLGAIIAEFSSLVPANSSMRDIIYSYTDPQVLQADVEAQNRGVDVRGLLDRSQSIGPTEARQLQAFFSQIKRWDSSGNPLFVIGTSNMDGQIIHGKIKWANWKGTIEEMPVYSDWRDYVKAGYPTVLRGSYNWSSSAMKQVNTLCISPSPELCQMYQKVFDEIWAYNLQHNLQWNVPGLKLSEKFDFISDANVPGEGDY